MPMVPEAVIAMLACARLGAVHSVVFGGFAAHELAVRIDDARPTVVVSASLRHRGHAGRRVQADARPAPRPRRARARRALRHPAAPAGRGHAGRGPRPRLGRGRGGRRARRPVRPGRGHRPALRALHLGHHRQAQGRRPRQRRPRRRAALDHAATSTTSQPGDVFWAASDVGWVVGHSYIVYAPAAARARRPCSTRASRSARPTPGAFWRVAAEHGVKVLFTAPTAFRAIKKEDPEGAHLAGHDLSALQTLFLAGERLDPDTYHWAVDQLGIPVIDHWWQTETGWPIAANLHGHRARCRSSRARRPCRCPATTCEILDATGRRGASRGDEGSIVHQAAAAARHAADAVGRRRPLRRVVPVDASPATTSPATAATSTTTATCS